MGEDRFCGDLICLLRRHLPQRGSRGGDLFRRSAPPSPKGEGREATSSGLRPPSPEGEG